MILEAKHTIMALSAGAPTKRVGNVKDVANYLNRVDEMIEIKKMEELAWH